VRFKDFVYVAAFLGTWSFSGPVLGNDAEMGGVGTDLVPTENTSVALAKEDITLRLRGDKWSVVARYVFKNPDASPHRVTMGFPEHACAVDDEDCPKNMFSRMKTSVRGRRVRHRQGSLRPEHAWAKLLGPVWLYDVAFEPRETVEIVHEYAMEPGGSITGAAWVDYITRTGALWAGTIGEATFTFILPQQAMLLAMVPEVPVSVTREGDKIHVVFTHSGWEPEHDLTLHYALTDVMLPWTIGEEPGGFDWDLAMKRSGVRSHCRALGDLDPGAVLNGLEVERVATELAASSSDLRLCRNAIYARRGKIFEDESLNRYFYGESTPVPGSRAHFAWIPTTRGATPLFATDRTRLGIVERAAALRESGQVTAAVEVAPVSTTEPGSTETPGPGSAEPQGPGSAEPQAPGSAVSQAPGSAVSQAPGSAVSQAPGSAVSQAPGSAGPQAPGSAVSQAPGSAGPQGPGSAVPQELANSVPSDATPNPVHGEEKSASEPSRGCSIDARRHGTPGLFFLVFGLGLRGRRRPSGERSRGRS